MAERLSHLAKDFQPAIRGIDKVLIETDVSWLEKKNEAGASERKISFFIAFGMRLKRGKRLMDRADIGGADFNKKHGAEVLGFERCDHPFVLCKDLGVFFECGRIDGE